VVKEGDFDSRHTNNSDSAGDESQASNKFHCTSATTDTIKLNLTKNNSHMTSKSADYFKRLLESQNKKSKAFVDKVSQ
jgi:hypothetical protein